MTAVDDAVEAFLLDAKTQPVPDLVTRTLADSVLYRVNFTKPAGPSGGEDRHRAPADECNVVSSEIASGRNAGRHRLLIDLDIPAALVPSTTPGHSHLYIDTACTTDQLVAVLDALVAAGAVEAGYAAVSAARGGTSLRMPHIRKEPEDVVNY